MVEPIAIATCGTTLMLNSDDLRRDRRPFSERKAALARLRSCDGIQYVEHAEGHCNKSLPPSATLALRASFQKTERPTLWAIETLDQGQRIRRHRRRRVFWTGHSDTTAKRTRGQSTCARNSVGIHDKTNRRPLHAETHRRCRRASPRRGGLLSLKRKASRTLEVTGSPWR